MSDTTRRLDMKVVDELLKELQLMKAREERTKDAVTHIHSAIGKTRRRPMEESNQLAIEADLFDAIMCLKE